MALPPHASEGGCAVGAGATTGLMCTKTTSATATGGTESSGTSLKLILRFGRWAGARRRESVLLLTNSHEEGVVVRIALICFGRVYARGRFDGRKLVVIFHDGLDEAKPGRRTYVDGRKDCVHRGQHVCSRGHSLSRGRLTPSPFLHACTATPSPC
jgi:hypothetical protein